MRFWILIAGDGVGGKSMSGKSGVLTRSDCFRIEGEWWGVYGVGGLLGGVGLSRVISGVLVAKTADSSKLQWNYSSSSAWNWPPIILEVLNLTWLLFTISHLPRKYIWYTFWVLEYPTKVPTLACGSSLFHFGEWLYTYSLQLNGYRLLILGFFL